MDPAKGEGKAHACTIARLRHLCRTSRPVNTLRHRAIEWKLVDGRGSVMLKGNGSSRERNLTSSGRRKWIASSSRMRNVEPRSLGDTCPCAQAAARPNSWRTGSPSPFSIKAKASSPFWCDSSRTRTRRFVCRPEPKNIIEVGRYLQRIAMHGRSSIGMQQ